MRISNQTLSQNQNLNSQNKLLHPGHGPSSGSGSGSIHGGPQNGKWAVNIQDIMKRDKNALMQQLGSEYAGQEGGLMRQDSMNSDPVHADEQYGHPDYNYRLATLQQQNNGKPEHLMAQAKVANKVRSKDKMNTIQMQQNAAAAQKKSSSKARGNSVNQKGQAQKSMSKGGGEQTIQILSQKQTLNQVLGQITNQGGKRGTTPLRMGRQNQSAGNQLNLKQPTNANSSAQMQINNQKKANQIKTKTSNNQQIKGFMAAALASVKANEVLKNATPNGQDENPFSVSESTDLKILKASSVNQKYMTELINNQKITPGDINRKIDHLNVLSSDDEPHRLEEGSNQNQQQQLQFYPQPQRGSSEYVNTDDEGEEHNQEFGKYGSQGENNYLVFPSAEDDMAVLSDGDQLNVHKKAKSRKRHDSTSQKRNGKSSASRGKNSLQIQQMRPQTTNPQLKRSALNSIERKDNINIKHVQSVTNHNQGGTSLQKLNSTSTQRQPKSGLKSANMRPGALISPVPGGDAHFNFDLHTQTMSNLKDKVQNQENQFSQLNQKIDIFEEELIKRVREIQKYSKGLNTLIRKNIMSDIENLKAGNTGGGNPGGNAVTGEQLEIIKEIQQEQTQSIKLINDQMAKLNGISESIETEMNNKFEMTNMRLEQNENYLQESQDMQNQFMQLDQTVQEQQQQINQLMQNQNNAGNLEQIEQKLQEQNEIIGLLDEQSNNQEAQLVKLQNEQINLSSDLLQRIEGLGSQQAPNPAVASSRMFDVDQIKAFEQKIQNLFEQLQEVDQKHSLKAEELQDALNKQAEDGEGRDGLILQHNTDIQNLYGANEQILENEKSFKLQSESINEQLQNFESELQKMVTAEVVENSLNDYAANFVTQEMIANFVNTDVVEGSLNQLNDDLRAELDDIRNNQPVPEASNQEEELQHVHSKITEHQQHAEGRLQLCIETLKDEMLNQYIHKNNESHSENLETLQHCIENVQVKVQKLEKDCLVLMEQAQNQEIQLQAQFDEQVNQLEEQFKNIQMQIQQKSDRSEGAGQRAPTEETTQLKEMLMKHEQQLQVIENQVLVAIQESLMTLESNINQNQNDPSPSKKEETEEQIQQICGIIQNLQQQSSGVQDQLLVNTQQLDQHDSKFNNHQQEFQAHREELASHQQDFNQHKEALTAHQSEFEYHKEALATHQQEFSAHQNNLQSHQQDLAAHLDQFNSHQEDFQSHQEVTQSHNDQFNNHAENIQQHAEQIDTLFAQHNEMSKMLKYGESISFLEQKVQLVEQEAIQRQQQDKQMFQSMVEQDKKVFQQMISQLEEQLHVKLESSISQISPIEVPVAQEQPSFSTNHLELQIKQNAESHKNDLDRMNRLVNELEIQMKKVYQENGDKIDQLSTSMQTQKQITEQQIDDLQETDAKLQELQSVMQQVEANVAQLQEIDHVQVQNDVSNLHQMYQQHGNEVNQLKQNHKEHQDEVDQLRENHQDHQNQVEQLMESHQGLKESHRGLKEGHEGHREEVSRLKQTPPPVQTSSAGLGQEEFDSIMEQLKPIGQMNDDILTMKHLINILQDSNFQQQIEEVKNKVEGLAKNSQTRFSMPQEFVPKFPAADPEPISENTKENSLEEDMVIGSRKKKKTEAVRSAHPAARKQEHTTLQVPVEAELQVKDSEISPLQSQIGQVEQPESQKKSDQAPVAETSSSKMVDLSPIKQASALTKDQDPENEVHKSFNVQFQETDEDLKDKLNNLFKGQPADSDAFDDEFNEDQQIPEVESFMNRKSKGEDKVSFAKTDEKQSLSSHVDNLFEKTNPDNEEGSQDEEDNYSDDFDDATDPRVTAGQGTAGLQPYDQNAGNHIKVEDEEEDNKESEMKSESSNSRIYQQEVKLPMMESQPQYQHQRSGSFINSSQPNTYSNITPNIISNPASLGITPVKQASDLTFEHQPEEDDNLDRESAHDQEEPEENSMVSLGGIDLKDEHNQKVNEVLEHLNFEQMLHDNIDEIIKNVLHRQ